MSEWPISRVLQSRAEQHAQKREMETEEMVRQKRSGRRASRDEPHLDPPYFII